MVRAHKPYKTKPIEKRLWPKVKKTEHCWIWIASKDTNGYGQFPIKGKPIKPAHKVIYELLIAEVPKGMVLDHLCCVRECVNPEHLEIVTSAENTLRGTSPSAVNARKTHCPNGHKYTEVELYYGKKGDKTCKPCHLSRIRERRALKKLNETK